MQEINGAEAIIKVLEDLGVRIIFGYPGGANLPIYDALAKSTQIKHILARHEQGAAFMAGGYARVKGVPGVCLATSGPGVTNLITGLADAYLDSVPILALTGQISRDFVGTDAFQEVDTFNMTIPITKHNELIYNEKELVPAIRSAFFIASSGRYGPTLVDIPRDIQEKKAHYDLSETRENKGYQPTLVPHIGQIKRCFRALRKAERPLIIAGGGVVLARANQKLLAFVEKTGVPVVRTLMGKSAMPEDHDLFLGMLGTHGNADANRAVVQSDMVLAIGTRFGDRSTMQKKSYFLKDKVVVHIDIDPAEISKTVAVDIPMVGDINEALNLLLKGLVERAEFPKQKWFKRKTNDNILGKWEEAEIIGLAVSEISKIDQELHLSTDVGRHQMWATHFCNNSKHWPLLTSGGLGTMGFGLPAAIGAWFADPTKPAINITGDGSFYMNMQEFVVAVEYDVPLTVFIVNDQKLGMIRELQKTKYGGRYFGHNFKHTIDFVGLARAMGGQGYKINHKFEILPTLLKAIKSKKPCIIDFDLHRVAKGLAPTLKAM
ncbi:MAG: biosynthetic-type acetolactate synthase large subunit [SAR324 cluster bacterium]|nr:biosynthetic-type acetolactate synthase large subunit [SAR324 cluster bacterium]